MVCPKCGSENVNISIVNNKVKSSHAGALVKMGRAFLVLCTCGLWLLVPKSKGNSKIKSAKMAVCQSCGNSWKM